MPVTPTGNLLKTKYHLEQLIAESATFQDAVSARGTAQEKIDEAKNQIHLTAYERDENVGFVRPFALIMLNDQGEGVNDAVSQFALSGQLELRLEQDIPRADDWICPTGYIDAGSYWDDEEKIIDRYPPLGDVGTYTYGTTAVEGEWLELTVDSTSADKIRVWVGDNCTRFDVDVYTDSWIHVVDDLPSVFDAWAEYDIPGAPLTITKARVRLWFSSPPVKMYNLQIRRTEPDYSADPENGEAYFMNFVEGVLADVEALSVTPGYLAISNWSVIEGPALCEAGQNLFIWGIRLLVNWGLTS